MKELLDIKPPKKLRLTRYKARIKNKAKVLQGYEGQAVTYKPMTVQRSMRIKIMTRSLLCK